MTQEELRVDRSEINKNRKLILQSFDHYIPDEMTYNGYVDSRQVLVYFKDGEEIARYENSVMTYTPRFKELCHELVNEIFEGEMK